MNNKLEAILFGSGLILFGIINLIFYKKFSKIPKNKNPGHYYSPEQSKNKRIMGGIGFIILGLIVILYTI